MAGMLKKKTTLVDAAQNPSSRQFEIDNWELSELIVKELVPVVGVHPFPLNELLLMCGAVARFKPTLIFEWGTHVGKSARIFYEISEALELKTVIHSVDLPDGVEHGEHPYHKRGKMVQGLSRVKLHQGDGLDTALEIMDGQKSPTRKGGHALFFVDGDHSYESVKRELDGIIEAAPRAVVLLHDTFYQLPDSRYNIGPYRAIRDCLKNSQVKYRRVDTATGLPGMTLLYPI
ncbi:MAG: class I SAM-dependent methyltransferase [Candidatus Saccharimonadales bacterium]